MSGEPELSYVLSAPSAPSAAVTGESARFAVRRIYCVGQNYASHAREMGADPKREPPFFFMKPATALLADHGGLPYPPRTANLHHEVELVVALKTGGRHIAAAGGCQLVSKIQELVVDSSLHVSETTYLRELHLSLRNIQRHVARDVKLTAVHMRVAGQGAASKTSL